MKRYNWFTRIAKSMAPSDFYTDILEESIAKAFGYIILLILVLSVGVGFYTGYELKVGLDAMIEDYELSLLPKMHLDSDGLTVEGDSPVILTYFDNFVALDDDFSLDINEFNRYDNAMLFQKNGVTVTTKGVGPFTLTYDQVLPMFAIPEIPSGDVAPFLKIISGAIIPASIITQILLSTTNFFFNSLFILLMANLMQTFAGLKLKLGTLYHMTIYALTFTVIWTHFSSLLPRQVPIYLDNFVFYVIPSLILYFVFRKIRIDGGLPPEK